MTAATCGATERRIGAVQRRAVSRRARDGDGGAGGADGPAVRPLLRRAGGAGRGAGRGAGDAHCGKRGGLRAADCVPQPGPGSDPPPALIQ